MNSSDPVNLITDTRRIDIDLLRAVAVLAVILFHFDFYGFSGGFLGVDVFFVISGYLITSHIKKEISDGSFRFTTFYVRRIRRLAPALIATFILTSIAALIFLPRNLLLDFADSQIASAFYVSNVYFWFVADYFDTSNYLKPLLHTWSLSVEEQFYMIWPLMLVFFGLKRLGWFIGLIGIASLIAAEVIYDISAVTTFYMFPFRIFEFAIGATISVRGFLSIGMVARSFLVFLAVGILLGSIFLANENYRFPGILSLPICLASAIIILVEHPVLNRQYMLIKPLLYIGLISYSAYLVHWPLMVFYKIIYGPDLQISDSLLLLGGTLLLAGLFYRYIEVPGLRIRIANREPKFYGALIIVGMLCVGYDFSIPQILAFSKNNDVTVKAVIDNTVTRKDEQPVIEARIKLMNQAKKTDRIILVVGDSHSIDVAIGLHWVFESENLNIKIMHSVCEPVFVDNDSDLQALYLGHPNKHATAEICKDFNPTLIEKMRQYKPKMVVFSERWRSEALPFLKTTLTRIRQEVTDNILVLGPNFEFAVEPRVVLRGVEDVSLINTLAWDKRKNNDDLEDNLQTIANESNVAFLSKESLVCYKESCNILLDKSLGYSDSNHWTWEGMKVYGRQIALHPIFARLLVKMISEK